MPATAYITRVMAEREGKTAQAAHMRIPTSLPGVTLRD
jgi:hypothetical protein